MEKISVLIPSRGEKPDNLLRTLQSIKEGFVEDYEVIVGIDGQPYTDIFSRSIVEDMGIKFIKFPTTVGIKTNLNSMAAMATGKYLLKFDAHCAVSSHIDKVLKMDMEDDWIVMPRFKIIKDDWSIQMRNGQEEFYDYFYLCCPFTDPKGIRFKAGGHWKERTIERLPKYNSVPYTVPYIDETPQIHGSGWFMTKDRYFELGGFPNIDVYGHAQEPIWLAMKNWMAGGKVMVNKNCWYAHLHQQGNKRGYHMDSSQEKRSYDIAAKYWLSDKWDDTWPKKVMTFEQFVDKFMPMPGWPDNWKELLFNFKNDQNK